MDDDDNNGDCDSDENGNQSFYQINQPPSTISAIEFFVCVFV